MLDWFQDKSLTVLERPSLNSDFNPPQIFEETQRWLKADDKA